MPDVAAFPFINVEIDTSALVPLAARAPGVIAVVGSTVPIAGGNAVGTAAADQPFEVGSRAEAATLFAKVSGAGVVTRTPLFNSLELALLQDPRPSRIYGVRIDAANGGFAAGLAALEAADDVTFVALASEVDPANLSLLRSHVESMSSQGQKRIGVGMIDPLQGRSTTYVADRAAAVAGVKSDGGRMVMVAARGATRDVGGGVVFSADAATASMAAMAGYPPQTSVLLKPLRGFSMPIAQQYSPSEIGGLSRAEIIPIIDPALIPGESLHLGEGATFSTNAALGYVDIVRVLDDIDFRLKAGLIGLVGDARITKAGLTLLKTQIEGILGPLRRSAVIDSFSIDIPLLDILSMPEAVRSAADDNVVATARASRTVDATVSITYGPAVHLLLLTLAPKF
jgi:hypothetical protein